MIFSNPGCNRHIGREPVSGQWSWVIKLQTVMLPRLQGIIQGPGRVQQGAQIQGPPNIPDYKTGL